MNPTVDSVNPQHANYVNRPTRGPKIEIYVQYKKPRAKVLVSLALDDIDSGTGFPRRPTKTGSVIDVVRI